MDMESSGFRFVQTQRLPNKWMNMALMPSWPRAGINFTYLSGLVYPARWRAIWICRFPRGVYLVWPRTGEPRMVVNAIAEGLRDGIQFIEHFDVYEGYSELPVERLAKVIDRHGLADRKSARDNSSAPPMGHPAQPSARMRASDSVHLMDTVRAVKTQANWAFETRCRPSDELNLTHFSQPAQPACASATCMPRWSRIAWLAGRDSPTAFSIHNATRFPMPEKATHLGPLVRDERSDGSSDHHD